VEPRLRYANLLILALYWTLGMVLSPSCQSKKHSTYVYEMYILSQIPNPTDYVLGDYLLVAPRTIGSGSDSRPLRVRAR
jgi:hypothetical protein